jgi:RNA polymerase sigma factor (sigma-70 family)
MSIVLRTLSRRRCCERGVIRAPVTWTGGGAESRPKERSEEFIDEYAWSDDVIERLVDASEVRAAVNALPERLRVILVEIYFHDRSVAEVADLLDIPQGTVRSRTFYGLRALRETLPRSLRGRDDLPANR